MKTIIAFVVLILLVVGLWLLRKLASSTHKQATTIDSAVTKWKRAKGDSPIAFGYKCMWVAVKTTDKEKVADILGIKDRRPCNWVNGIDAAYDNKIFITPAVGQWTLVVGYGMSNPKAKKTIDEAESFKAIIDKLSRAFGEAQFFLTHRVAEYHVWAKSINGHTIRYYSYLGESGENPMVDGKPTTIEKQYNLVNTLSQEAKDSNYLYRRDLVFPDEELVMTIAGNWSINPQTLEIRKDVAPGLGILGE